jgi:hypothetical protein
MPHGGAVYNFLADLKAKGLSSKDDIDAVIGPLFMYHFFQVRRDGQPSSAATGDMCVHHVYRSNAKRQSLPPLASPPPPPSPAASAPSHGSCCLEQQREPQLWLPGVAGPSSCPAPRAPLCSLLPHVLPA